MHTLQIIGMGTSGIKIVNHLLEKLPRLVNVGVIASDKRALSKSTAESKLLLLPEFKGLGNSANIETARILIDKSKENIKRFINSDTAILTAGMGGQSSYTLPFVAQIINEMGVRAVGVVSMPFYFEGPERHRRADAGLKLSQEFIPVLSIIKADEVLKLQNLAKPHVTDAFLTLNDWMSKTVLIFSDLFQEQSK
jgi:cell division protein FtsZ